MRSTRARRLALGLVILALAWPLSGIVAARALTARVHARTLESPDGSDPPYEALRLRTRDGLSIGAWLAERVDDDVAVVLVHGHGASRSQLQDEARALWHAGASVMPISMRAHGDSDGERDDLGWSARRDVEAAVAHLASRAPSRPIVVLGYSAGAAAAAYAAADLGPRVRGYVLVAPYADLADATRARTRRYLPPGVELVAYGALRVGASVVLPELDRMRPIDAMGAIGAPMLLVAGERDARAPLADVRRMAAATHDARVVVLPGVDHEDLGRFVAMPEWSEVTALLDRVRGSR